MSKNLFIFDGSNFYHYTKKMCPDIHLTHFDYRAFAEKVVGEKCDINYCVGEIKQDPKNKKTIKLYANQQKLFFNLEKQGVRIRKGYMLKNQGVYHEKGVDVRIAIDIVRGALKKEYNNCFLVSSDSDLLPAIIDAKKEGKKIIYIGFKDFISNSLKRNSSKTFEIDKKFINSFIKKKTK